MWTLVFIYFYDAQPYVESVDTYTSMTDCFFAREELAADVGIENGHFKAGQQAICINMVDTGA